MEKAKERSNQMKSQADERTQHQLGAYMNEKIWSNECYQTISFRIIDRMKQTGMTDHNTTIKPIQ